MTPVESFLSRLPSSKKSGKGWCALCPAHEDRRPSLSISEGDDGRVLVKCHVGCTADAITKALGISTRDLMPDHGEAGRGTRTRTAAKIAAQSKPARTFATASDAVEELERTHGPRFAEWIYHDADEKPVGVVVRWNLPDGTKEIRPVSLVGDDWKIGAMPEPRPLYNLPALAKADFVIVTEGEKVADAAIDCGFTATTSAGGSQAAGKTDWRPLSGKKVLMLPDNDEPGRKFEEDVKVELDGVAARLMVVELPGLPPKGDLCDWLAIEGNDKAALSRLIQAATDAGDARHGDAWNGPTPVAQMSSKTTGPTAIVIAVADLPELSVEWLWPSYIPLGAVTILDGDPGLGKSTLTADIAARVSRGWPMPDGTGAGIGPAGVLILNAEDDAARTIRPRMIAADADLSRVHIFAAVKSGDGTTEPPVLPAHLEMIEREIVRFGARLVVIDPFTAYLDSSVDSHKDADVRRVLHRIKEIAERRGCAVLIVRHLNKQGGGQAIYRGGGSIGIIGASRSALLLGGHPEDAAMRVLAPVKCNLCPMPPSLAFAHEPSGEVSRLGWLGATTFAANDLLANPNSGNSTKADGCADALAPMLKGRSVEAREAIAELTSMGYSERTIQRTRRTLKVRCQRVGFGAGGKSMLSLPDAVDGEPPTDGPPP